jgi:hypothetical protein
VFILYALLAGLVLGFVAGGRLDGLATLSFRWSWLAIAGLGTQLVLFAGPLAERVGAAGPVVYVASMAAVAGFLVGNLRLPGVVVIAVGAAFNFAAILANGGVMPASASALAAAGIDITEGFTNSREVAAPVLLPLGDVFGLPSWMPFSNVFSIGDVLIGAGVMIAVVVAMRRPLRPETSAVRQDAA